MAAIIAPSTIAASHPSERWKSPGDPSRHFVLGSNYVALGVKRTSTSVGDATGLWVHAIFETRAEIYWKMDSGTLIWTKGFVVFLGFKVVTRTAARDELAEQCPNDL